MVEEWDQLSMVAQLSNEQIDKLTKAVNSYDEDPDGCREEVRNVLRSLGKNPTQAELQNIIDEILLTARKEQQAAHEKGLWDSTYRYIRSAVMLLAWYSGFVEDTRRLSIPKKTNRSIQAKKETEEGWGWGCEIM